MSCRMIPLQGFVGLQSKSTAIGVADEPWMSLYCTWLIFTPELCIIHTITEIEYDSEIN